MNEAPAPFTRAELEEALRAIDSTISKCEKVAPKLRPGSSQHTLLARRLSALRIASTLIERALAVAPGETAASDETTPAGSPPQDFAGRLRRT